MNLEEMRQHPANHVAGEEKRRVRDSLAPSSAFCASITSKPDVSRQRSYTPLLRLMIQKGQPVWPVAVALPSTMKTGTDPVH